MTELQAAARDGGHIAIVDDDEAFADSLAAMLRSAGLSCIAFGDVARMLASLESIRILAVLLDVRMPALAGSAAIRAILDVAPTLRIVSITAHAEGEELETLYAAGTRAVLIKPFRLVDVLTTLARV